MTGAARSFMERLLYPYLNPADPSVLPEKKIQTGLIFTFGATEEQMIAAGWDQHLRTFEMLMKTVFGNSESMFVSDTSPYEDFSKYSVSPLVDPEEKARIKREVFPGECEKAFEMGARFAHAAGATE
jgi:multimeric flavodoxin WrbA